MHALEDAGVPFSAFESLFNEVVVERYQRMFRCTCAEHEMCECDAASAAADIIGSDTFLSGFDCRTPMQRHQMMREIDSKLKAKDAECKLEVVKSALCAIVSDDLGQTHPSDSVTPKLLSDAAVALNGICLLICVHVCRCSQAWNLCAVALAAPEPEAVGKSEKRSRPRSAHRGTGSDLEIPNLWRARDSQVHSRGPWTRVWTRVLEKAGVEKHGHTARVQGDGPIGSGATALRS